jgi:hypothetical protein
VRYVLHGDSVQQEFGRSMLSVSLGGVQLNGVGVGLIGRLAVLVIGSWS